MIQKKIFDLLYLPNIQFFTKLIGQTEIWIEGHSSYSRQTYRNRTDILSANGKTALSIPVEKSSKDMIVKDIKIAYHQAWQHQHWMAFVSAYRSSPFFECVADELHPFYHNKLPFLWDFNYGLFETALSFLDLDLKIHETDEFLKNRSEKFMDYRELIHPKKKYNNDKCFKPQEYYQVFAQKHGFTPNLSILDLICNEGRNAFSILKESFSVC